MHDGLGETLLYRNLARRLPEGIAVYGIEPKRLPGIPLAHSSIPAMARWYVDRIKQMQPHGPYLLGGMCAGGVIAYAMAACLNDSGDTVQLVAILDGAAPQSQKKTGVIARRRLSSIKEAVAERTAMKAPALSKWLATASIVVQKTRNTAFYMVSSRAHRISVRSRVALLKSILKRGAAWPKILAPLSVQEIYDAIESEYRPPALTSVPVLLVRASEGNGTDTPYRDLFLREDLGWSRVAGRLELADVRGGHASMLQEHCIDSLVSALSNHLKLPAVPAVSVSA
ncbi:MAG: thioesterase domain-containing protein [Steroidobacteraceae bacterium]